MTWVTRKYAREQSIARSHKLRNERTQEITIVRLQSERRVLVFKIKATQKC